MELPFSEPFKETYDLIPQQPGAPYFLNGFRVYFKGPSTQIVGFSGPKTTQSMDFGAENLTIWLLGPFGLGFKDSSTLKATT